MKDRSLVAIINEEKNPAFFSLGGQNQWAQKDQLTKANFFSIAQRTNSNISVFSHWLID
jgi:hypothetical protein